MSSQIETDLLALQQAITAGPIRFSNETELQNLLEGRLRPLGEVQREYRLSPKDRPDFFWRGIAVEVKDHIGRSAIWSQLDRYSKHEEVKAVVLVIPKISALPVTLSGKPCVVISLWKLMI